MEQTKSETDPITAAAEALDRALARMEERFVALEQKIDRIVAMVEERPTAHASERKTVSAQAAALLSKFGSSDGPLAMTSADEMLRALSVEQRIAVKAELARAGILQ